MVFFWVKKLMEKMIFTDYGKVLLLNFSVVGNTVFFEPRSWWKDYIYWLWKRYCFELFGGNKYGLSFNKEVDGKMIFTDYREIPQICATPLGNSKTKNVRPMENQHDFFWITHRKFSFLIDSGIFACFFQCPSKFYLLNPPPPPTPTFFFWNRVTINNVFG